MNIDSNTTSKIRKSKEKTLAIVLQPFDDLPQTYSDHIYSELAKIIPRIELKKAIPLPASAFYKKRNRYRADSLIDFLKRNTPPHYITIGLTSKDISTTKDKHEDWGVMGLGFRPGPSCVVSSFRLSKNNLKEQFFKVALHELGHTLGLDHCPVKNCYMRDAEGKNYLDEETEFCESCKSYLSTEGLGLN